MNLFSVFETRVAEALVRLADAGRIPAGLDTGRVVVEPPRDASLGDLATNAALVLAKEARMNPRALADMIAGDLAEDPRVGRAEVAGPGFINLSLVPGLYQEVLLAAVTDPEFGRSRQGFGQKIN